MLDYCTKDRWDKATVKGTLKMNKKMEKGKRG